MLLIDELKRTCTACPTQYEGRTPFGNYVYIRYRWGTLTLGTGKTIDEAVRNTILQKDLNSQLDGFISFKELKTELSLHDIFINDDITFNHEEWELVKRRDE